MSTEQLIRAATVTSKHSIKVAERAAAKVQKQQLAKQIDEAAKAGRESAVATATAAKMAAALAEPADIGRGAGKRRRGSTNKAKAIKANKKPAKLVVPDWDFEDDMDNATKATVDELTADSVETPEPSDSEMEHTSAGASEPFSALPGPTPVMVDGKEEWVVKRISNRKFFNERGRIFPKWRVEWEGGEVTWENYNVVKNCTALDVFECKRRAAKRPRVQ